MDRLDAIRCFVRVVQCGSFSAVARENGVGQPVISKQIAALEAYLGADLLHRSSRQLSMTDAGEAFFEAAKRLIAEADAAESLVGKRLASPTGLVRLATAPVLGRSFVVPKLSTFFRQYPGIKIEMSSSERHVDLLGDGIDLAIRHGNLENSALKARRIAFATYSTVGSRNLFEKVGVPITPADLVKYPCIAYTPSKKVRAWQLCGANGELQQFAPEGNFRTGDAEQIRAAVLSGLGIAQAPSWLFAGELQRNEVVSVLDAYQPPPQAISLVYSSRGEAPHRVRVLMSFLSENLPDGIYIKPT